MSRRRKWLRRLVLAGGGTLLVLVLIWGVMLALMWYWVATPPVLPPEAALAPKPETRGDRVYVGRSWFGRREGLPVLFLTGSPYEMGYANGVLTQKLMRRQEDSLLGLLDQFVPQRWAQFLIKFLLVYKNRGLPEHILPEHQLEILGLSRGSPDSHPGLGPYYYRLVSYHGAQDISYMVMNSPLLQRGCTAFGAWGAQTRDEHLLAGRNFDWEADPVFDEDRLLMICEPKEGIPFISLAWAGMAGCVSGMNREGISVTVNGAPSDLPGGAATPTCLVAREVLQHARTLAEATEIIRRRQVFVSALFLVGSRKDGRFVEIEKTPTRLAVREPDGQPFIISANHYLSPELATNALNLQFKRVDTSVPRFERMQALIERSAGVLTPEKAAEVLRDRRLPDGQFAGNGHRSTLNPLIATHAVIMDLTDGIFWAATPPHQLGRFVAFDLRQPEQALPDRALPEDPLLESGEYRRFQLAQTKLSEGWRALRQRDYERAVSCAREAETNNPGFYRNSWLLAQGLLAQGQTNTAAVACRAAMAGKPALGGEREALEQLARRIGLGTASSR